MFVGAACSPPHVLARAVLFIAFCLHRGFFWECEVLLCLQCAKKVLFTVFKGYFVCSVRAFFFSVCDDILFAVWPFTLFVVCRIYIVFRVGLFLSQELEFILFAVHLIL